jgi:hypothetical protein
MSDREEKLKKLQERKGGNMVILSDGAEFLEAFQKKISDLRKALGTTVDVNLDGLVEELGTIKTIAPVVERLREAIDAIELPDVPKNIELIGLDPIVAAISEHIKYINTLKNFKIPDPHVKVEIIDSMKIIEITNRLDNLVQAVEENKPGQRPEDFLPTRRVRMVGNKLMFDDNQYGGSGGGGASPHNSWTPKAVLNLKATPVKISQTNGAFGGYMINNPNNTPIFLQIFDTNVPPTVGTDSSYPFGIPASASANVEFTNGIRMGTGIYVACTTTASGAVAPTTGLDMTILYESS